MARKSLIEREKKKIKLVAKHADKRSVLKEEQRKAATFEEKMEIQRKPVSYTHLTLPTKA